MPRRPDISTLLLVRYNDISGAARASSGWLHLTASGQRASDLGPVGAGRERGGRAIAFLACRVPAVRPQRLRRAGQWPGNAWAYGNGKLGGGKLLHWNGKRWAAVSYPHQNTYLITAAFVLSPTDAWFAGQNETPPQYTPEILHWQDGSWSWLQLPSASNVATVDVLADDDIWVCGRRIAGCLRRRAFRARQGCTPT